MAEQGSGRQPSAVAAEIRRKYPELVKTGKVGEFKRLLELYKDHISEEGRKQMLDDFMQNVADWQEHLRKSV